MKINAGCGKRILRGWVNVDLHPNADVRCNLLDIDQHFERESADEIMAIHVIEHLHPHDVPWVLARFWFVMKPGGRLALELPDIVKCAQNLLDGKPDQLAMWGLYGEPLRENDPALELAQTHRWGWSFDTLRPLVVDAGFRDIVECKTQFHRAGREHRDFRLEAKKESPQRDARVHRVRPARTSSMGFGRRDR